MKEEYSETIIINRMYAGEYLNRNIGHEIINTYKCDNGKHYIYINPWGCINVDKQNVKYVLLVRAITSHCYEVIGYASDLKLLLTDNAMKSQKKAGIIDGELQLKYIRDNNISYGDLMINNIFAEQINALYVTFYAEKYRSVASDKKIYIIDDEIKYDEMKNTVSDNITCKYLSDFKFSSQSLKRYVDCTKDNSAYLVLKDMFENSCLWSDKDDSPFVDLNKEIDTNYGLLDILGKEDDELAYSNWLAYYLNEEYVWKDFAKEVLEIESENIDYQVKREYKNIDIWIESEKYICVLENKIRSGINGVNVIKHDIKSELIQSQLSKYVEVAEKEATEKDLENKVFYYILLPNYSYRDDDLKMYLKGDKYKIIRYSRIKEFFEKKNYCLKYMDEFIKCLKKHSTDYKKDMFEKMDERFISMIKRKKIEQ